MLLSCTVCSDMMLEAFMNKQGHDNRPKASGQAQAELDLSALSPQGQLQCLAFIVLCNV